jgi:predicted SprT family Zn-dependent metalloprotease
MSVTIEQTEAFQNMYDYLNVEFFDGELSPCILNFSRKSKAYGFFAPDRWENGGEIASEISLNPHYLSQRDPQDIVATLLHELCHKWQHDFGKPSRSGYHNKEWAAKMEEVGLIPSSTGKPGGKRTGQRVSHYIEVGGVFAQAFQAMPEEYWFPWVCAPEYSESGKAKGKGASKAKLKVKYSCGGCSTNVWGKGGLQLACVPCNDYFEEC